MDARTDLRSFEGLLDRCERSGPRQRGFDDLRELARLYRLHAAELARLRQRDDDPEAVRHRNALCVRAHGLLHAHPLRVRARGALREGLADALARTWRHQLAAWVLLAAGALVGVLVAAGDPAAVPGLVPAGLGYGEAGIDELAHSPAARSRFLAREETAVGEATLFGSTLFAHNLRVALLAFASGMLAGIPTVLLLLSTGVMLGAFAWIFLRGPDAVGFLAWLLPHGVPELTAIALCAAGGLALGNAVAAPGRRSRRRALREAVDPALLLVGLSVPMLALAAGMESFVRESTLGTAPRLAIAAVEATLLAWGLATVRRMARRRGLDRSWLAELAGRS